MLGAALVLSFAGCTGITGISEGAEEPVAVDEFPLSVTKMVLFTGRDGLSIKAELPENLAEIATLLWESEHSEIAEVGESGDTVTVSPIAQGSTTVTATIVPNEGFVLEGALSAKCEVTVLDDFALDQESLLLFAGETARSVAVGLPNTVFEVMDVEWTAPGAPFTTSGAGREIQIAPPASLSGTAGGPLIATLRSKADAEGAFNGDGKQASIQVTAYPALSLTINPLGSVELAESPLNGPVTKNLTAVFTPAALTSLSPAPVLEWSSDTEAVAAVTAGSFPNATLTAKKAGSAVITARLLSSGREVAATLAVTVTNWVDKTVPVTAVSIAPKPAQLAVGDETAEMVVTVSPANATDKTVSWEFNGASSNAALQLVTVNASQGKYKLKGLAAGSNIVVKAKAHNGVADQFTLSATALGITVTKTAGNDAMTNKATAETAKLKADITPAFASNKKVLWTSSNSGALALSASSTTSGAEVTLTAKLVSTQTQVTVTAKPDQDQTKSASYQFTIKPPVYKVQYDKNTGAGSDMAQSTHTYGTASALSANTYTKTGHTFKGWNTKADGTGSLLTQASSLANTQDTVVTVYASWELKKYSLKYYPNGGAGTASTYTVNHGTSYTVGGWGAFTPPTGNVFKEWHTTATGTGGTSYLPGATFTAASDVDFYAQWMPLGGIPSGKGDSSDLMVKFGIKEPGYENNYTKTDVTNTFLAVKAYINNAGTTASGSNQAMKLGSIALGDYVDLRSLSVAAYESRGDVDFTSNEDINIGGVNYGKALRILVVGINSHNGKNGNGSAKHLVFQFQNLPARQLMGAAGSPNADGYEKSLMRKYLTQNFLPGLIAAGMPESVLWAPERKIGAAPSGSTVQTISGDKLWIPTYWEVTGSNKHSNGSVLVAGETAENQAWYSYYPASASAVPARTKYGVSSLMLWWIASVPNASGSGNPRLVYYNDMGFFNSDGNSNSCGVAPVFSVR